MVHLQKKHLTTYLYICNAHYPCYGAPGYTKTILPGLYVPVLASLLHWIIKIYLVKSMIHLKCEVQFNLKHKV